MVETARGVETASGVETARGVETMGGTDTHQADRFGDTKKGLGDTVRRRDAKYVGGMQTSRKASKLQEALQKRPGTSRKVIMRSASHFFQASELQIITRRNQQNVSG